MADDNRAIATALREFADQIDPPKPKLPGFSVLATVQLSVPNPTDRADYITGNPYTPDELFEWLHGLVCNAPPKGVNVSVWR